MSEVIDDNLTIGTIKQCFENTSDDVKLYWEDGTPIVDFVFNKKGITFKGKDNE